MKKIQQAAWVVVVAAAVALAVGPAQAKSLDGSWRGEDTVSADGAIRYTETFRGGERAIVMVEGGGALAVRVYDQAGNVVASCRDAEGQCVVNWIPDTTQEYIIRVFNCDNNACHFILHGN
jgi:hypothetical protein